jgi:hypothetical protein
MAYGHEDETNSSELGKELCVNENISISWLDFCLGNAGVSLFQFKGGSSILLWSYNVSACGNRKPQVQQFN